AGGPRHLDSGPVPAHQFKSSLFGTSGRLRDIMKRLIALLACAVAAVALTCSSADAHWRKTDRRVVAVEVGAGVVSTVAYGSAIGWTWSKHSSAYNWGASGYGTAGCIVLSPSVASAIMNRPVTPRNAWSSSSRSRSHKLRS